MKYIFKSILVLFIFCTSGYRAFSDEKTNALQQPFLNKDSSILSQLNNKAWKLRESDPKGAVLLLDSIIKFSLEKEEFSSLVVAYNNLGIIYANTGEYEKAEYWILKGFNIAIDCKDVAGSGRSLNNLAVVYRFQKRYSKSLEYINIAIGLHQKNKLNKLVGGSYINKAITYKEMGNYQDAMHYLQLAEDILKNESANDLVLHARLYVAENYILSRNYNQALTELQKLSPFIGRSRDISNLHFYHLLFGDYYFAINLFDEAKNEYLQAISIADNQNIIEFQIESLEKLIKLYTKTGDYKSAFLLQQKQHALNDSLKSTQNYLLISNVERQEAFDMRTNEQDRVNKINLQLQNFEILHQKRISGYLLLILIFLSVFGVFALIIYKQKLKGARLLASQRNEILLKNEALRLQMVEDREKSELIEYIDKENVILSLIAKETTNAVFILSPEGKIEWVNDAFQRISGFSLKEFKQVRGERLQEASSSATINEDLNECITFKKPVSYISKSLTKDNQFLWMHTTLSPVLDSDNQVIRLIAIDSDITNIKEAQDLLDQKNKEITSSLEYARRIQSSLMPTKTDIDNIFSDYFIINLPQSIVSGDFYWITKKNGQTLAVVADSTGHGVPGAFMSLLGISTLQEIVYKMENLDPALILELMREKVIYLLHHGNSLLSSSESWDIAVCVINEQKELKFAGSNNSAMILRDDVLIEVKPDKFFIWDEISKEMAFRKQTIQLVENDRIYLFTDGFSDQFGGREEKKFSHRKLKKVLLDIYKLPMEAQQELLNMIFKSWKGTNEQVDDIMVLGFSV